MLGGHGAVGAGQGSFRRGWVLLVAAHGRRAERAGGTGPSPSSRPGCGAGGPSSAVTAGAAAGRGRQDGEIGDGVSALAGTGGGRDPAVPSSRGALHGTATSTRKLLREPEPLTLAALSRLLRPVRVQSPAPPPHGPGTTGQPWHRQHRVTPVQRPGPSPGPSGTPEPGRDRSEPRRGRAPSRQGVRSLCPSRFQRGETEARGKLRHRGSF